MRTLIDEALEHLDATFNDVYADKDRLSIPPEPLIRASFLQVIYSTRNVRQLIEQFDYNLMFRWFVGVATHPVGQSDRMGPRQFVVPPSHPPL